MEDKYYIVVEGEQRGPFGKEALKYQGIKPSTYVWRAGLPDWVQASQLPELSDLLIDESAFGAYARVEPPQTSYGGNRRQDYGQQPYGQQPYGQQPPRYGYGQYDPYDQLNGTPVPHFNWQPWAIVGTVLGALFSCIGMIFGIIGITQANKANRYYGSGWKEQGDMANSSARTMTIISLVIAGIGLVMMLTGYTGTLLKQLTNLG